MIHLIDCDERPCQGEVEMNCGAKVVFYPIDADLKDKDVCQECLLAHKKGARKLTFAVMG